MYTYGQYCPVAMATEILGDRWTLLIVRDLLTGTSHFNDLRRGLPGISRGLLADRLRRLEQAGVVQKIEHADRRRRTEYCLTQAGWELQPVINALLMWGVVWAFDEPRPEDLDPLLLLWWMRQRVRVENLPSAERVVVQFDLTGPKPETYWLLLSRDDVSVCVTAPGFPVDVVVTGHLSDLYQIWLGRREYGEVLADGRLQVDATPSLARRFPTWFAYSAAADAVRAARQ
jgi:DNA-binding HxlR family transcriptional regulator